MKEKGGKAPRKGRTGRAKVSDARRLEQDNDERLVDKITRGRQDTDPSPLEQLKRMDGYIWSAIARAGEAMSTVVLAEAKDLNSLMQAAQRMFELRQNLASSHGDSGAKGITVTIAGLDPSQFEMPEQPDA